jgi:hypothetical protein
MKAIVAVYGKFADERARLLDALKCSAAANSPTLELCIVHPRPPREGAADRFAPKLTAWCDAVDFYDDDLLLLDADTLVLGDVTTVSRGTFDICHAPRPGKYPINTGVVFARPNKTTRSFMRAWLNRTEYWGLTKDLRNRARAEYAGTDQAAFAEALKIVPVNVNELDYTVWNLCQDFERMTPATKILHMKGFVHRECLAGNTDKVHPNVMREWNKYA